MEKVHIGNIIKAKFEESEHTVAWFARKINYDRTNIYRIYERESIDTDLLMKISEVLNFDFFIYYHPKIKRDN
jgi:plasmid maintenance system antidote protein VapI